MLLNNSYFLPVLFGSSENQLRMWCHPLFLTSSSPLGESDQALVDSEILFQFKMLPNPDEYFEVN